MNAVDELKMRARLRTAEAELVLWRQRAVSMAVATVVLSFFILCLGIGQMISGG